MSSHISHHQKELVYLVVQFIIHTIKFGVCIQLSVSKSMPQRCQYKHCNKKCNERYVSYCTGNQIKTHRMNNKFYIAGGSRHAASGGATMEKLTTLDNVNI